MRASRSSRARWLCVCIAIAFATRASAHADRRDQPVTPDIDLAEPWSSCKVAEDGAKACARVSPEVIHVQGSAAFREHRFTVTVKNTGGVDVEMLGVSSGTAEWRAHDFVFGEVIEKGSERAYELRYTPMLIGLMMHAIIFNTSAGPLVLRTSVPVYRNAYELSALDEEVPFEVPLEYDLVMFNPLAQALSISEIWTTVPEVTLAPSIIPINDASQFSKMAADHLNYSKNTVPLAKLRLLPGERAAVARLRATIRKEDCARRAKMPTEMCIVSGYVALNISSEIGLTFVPFKFRPTRDRVHVIERHLKFDDLKSFKDKRTRYLHVFNARKTAIEISSMQLEKPDRDVSIKFSTGTIVPPLKSVRVARITRTGGIEGYHSGVIRLQANSTRSVLRVPYSSTVNHGDLEYDADTFVFQAPPGPFGEKVSDDRWATTHKFSLKNTYSQPLSLLAWNFPPKDLTQAHFPFSMVRGVVDTIVPAGSTVEIEVDFKPRMYLAAMTTPLTIFHNASKTGTTIPLVVYSGELSTDSKIDFGVVGVGMKRTVEATFTNHNPVAMELYTMGIKGPRIVQGTTYSLQTTIYDGSATDKEYNMGDCIERSGRVCTQVLNAVMKTGDTLKVQLTAVTYSSESLNEQDGELSFQTSLGVETMVPVKVVPTAGKVISEDDGSVEINVPFTQLLEQGDNDDIVKQEVMVHSTHTVPVTVKGFLDTSSEFLDLDSDGDIVAAAGVSTSLGSVVFDTSRQRNELSHFGKRSKRSRWSSKSKTVERDDEDPHERAINKHDVQHLEKLAKSFKRLKEDDALMATGTLKFSSEANVGHQTVDIRARITYPNFLHVNPTEGIVINGNDGNVVEMSDSAVTVVSIVNPSTRRALCIRVLPITSSSRPTRRSRKKKVMDESLLQSSIRAAKVFSSVGEDALATNTDPGFELEYRVEQRGVCLRPEQKLDIATVVFEPKKRMRSYTASLCVKNDVTLLECVELRADSGAIVLEDEPESGVSILLRIVVGCTVAVLTSIATRPKSVDGVKVPTIVKASITDNDESPKESNNDAFHDSSVVFQDALDEEELLQEPQSAVEDNTRSEDAESPRPRSDDSAIEDLKRVHHVAATESPAAADTPKLDDVAQTKRVDDIAGKKSNLRIKTARESKQKSNRPSKETNKSPKAESETSPVQKRETNMAMPQPRVLIHRRHSLSKDSSQINTMTPRSVTSVEPSSPQFGASVDSPIYSQADTYTSMFSTDIIGNKFDLSPPPSVAPRSRPESLREFSMWSNADAKTGAAGWDSSSLFSFPSDGIGARTTASSVADPFSPQSRSTSKWRSMLSQWERSEEERSQSHSRSLAGESSVHSQKSFHSTGDHSYASGL